MPRNWSEVTNCTVVNSPYAHIETLNSTFGSLPLVIEIEGEQNIEQVFRILKGAAGLPAVVISELVRSKEAGSSEKISLLHIGAAIAKDPEGVTIRDDLAIIFELIKGYCLLPRLIPCADQQPWVEFTPKGVLGRAVYPIGHPKFFKRVELSWGLPRIEQQSVNLLIVRWLDIQKSSVDCRYDFRSVEDFLKDNDRLRSTIKTAALRIVNFLKHRFFCFYDKPKRLNSVHFTFAAGDGIGIILVSLNRPFDFGYNPDAVVTVDLRKVYANEGGIIATEAILENGSVLSATELYGQSLKGKINDARDLLEVRIADKIKKSKERR